MHPKVQRSILMLYSIKTKRFLLKNPNVLLGQYSRWTNFVFYHENAYLYFVVSKSYGISFN